MKPNYWNVFYQEIQPCISCDSDDWLDVHADFLPSGSRVLDLGCGAGTNVADLLARNLRVSAADLSREAVEMVNEAYGGQLASADCFDMRNGFPYENGSFDAVVADLSLHYFTWVDTQRIIDGIRRILHCGGVLIARVHSMENLPADAEEIERGYYQAYGYTRRYFTLKDIRMLFDEWEILSAEQKTARRYGGQKKVIEFVCRKLSVTI